MKNITFLSVVTFLMLLFSTTNSYSQTVYPMITTTGVAICDDGKLNCGAQSMQVVGAYLGYGTTVVNQHNEGDPISSCSLITDPNDVWLFIEILKNGNKHDLFVQYNLTIDDGINSNTTWYTSTYDSTGGLQTGLYKAVHLPTYSCGNQYVLSDILVGWNANDNGVPGCGGNNYSQCYNQLPSFTVNTPIYAGFDYAATCSTNEVSFTSTTSGGLIYNDDTNHPDYPFELLANPYSYEWNWGHNGLDSGPTTGPTALMASNANFTHTFPGPGIYNVRLTVRDSDTGPNIDDIVIPVTVYALPTVVVNGPLVIDCNNTTASLSGAGSDTVGVTYAWTASAGGTLTGATDAITATGTTAGTYTLTVSNTTSGCSDSADVSVTVDNTPPTAVVNGPLVIDCNNTTASLSGAGSDTVGVTYAWTASAGGTLTGATDAITATGTTAGTYTLTVSNTTSGCSDSADVSVTVDNTPPTVVVNGPLVIDCNNTTASLSGAGSDTVGVTYAWTASAGGTLTGATDAITATGTTAGTYTLTVSNTTSGCSDSADVSVTVDNTPPTAVVNGPLVIDCNNTTASLSGAGSDTVGVTYAWTASAGGTLTGATDAITATGTTAGTYTLTVSNTTSGCSDSADVSVTVDNTPPTVVVNGPLVIDCNNTTASLSGAGSDTVGVTYAWTASAGGTLTGATDAITATGTTAGTYTLTVSNTTTGCSDSADVSVTVDNTPPTVVVNGPLVIDCNNTTASLSGAGSDTVGVTYAWTASAGGTLTGATDAITATGTTAGTYTLTVSNTTSGCSDSADVSVTVDNTPPTVVVNGPLVIDCNNTTASLSGAGSDTVGVTYAWTASAGGTLTGATDAITATGTTAGTYTLTVSNTTTGCSDSADVSVTADAALPTVVVNGPLVIDCNNTTASLSGAGSDTVGVTYAWTASAGGTLTGATDAITATGTTAGTYTLTVSNTTSGCTSSADVSVTVDNTPPTVVVNGPLVIDCNNTTASLSGAGSDTVGVTYAWTASAGGTLTGATDAITATGTTAGTYTLTVSNTTTGCSDSADVSVTVDNTPPTVVVNGPLVIDCNNTTASLSGAGSDTVGVTYAWTASAGGTLTGATDAITATGTTAGTYTLTVSNTTKGCSDSADVSVTGDNTPPTAVVNGPLVIDCNNTTASLSGAGSDTVGVTYAWTASAGGTLTGATDAITATGTTAGTYTLTVSNTTTGCSDSADVSVTTGNAQPIANAGPNRLLTCTNSTAVLNGSANQSVSYSWTGPNNFSSSIANPTVSSPGNYTLTVTNGGCQDSDTVFVSQNIVKPEAHIEANAIELNCETTTITLNAVVDAIQGTASYTWLGTTEHSSSKEVDTPGIHSVIITDSANGCSVVVSINVTQDIEQPVATITGNEALTCINENIVLNASGSTAAGTVSYLWNTGATTDTISVSEPGAYSVTVSGSDNGCTDTTSVEVLQNISQPEAIISGNEELTCTTESVVLDASGSTSQGTLSFLWSTTETTSTIDVSTPGEYSVTVTDSDNGCSDTIAVTVLQDITSPEAVITGNEALTCANESIILDAGNSTGQAALSYEWSTGDTTSTIEVNEAGEYAVTVTDSVNGCSDTIAVSVLQNITSPTADAGLDKVLTCSDTSVQLDGSAESSNENANLTFIWSGPDSYSSDIATPTVSTPGTYTLTVTDSNNGCVANDSVEITQENNPPTASINAPVTALTCIETSVSLDASVSTGEGTFTYAWSTGATTASINVGSPGEYSVIVSNGDTGCSDTTSITVTQDISTIDVSVTGNEELTCEESIIVLDASGTSVQGTASYLWSTGETNSSIIVDGPGEYLVTVTDSTNGCSGSSGIIIVTQNTVPVELTGGSAELCITEPSLDLTTLLGNDYISGGTWTDDNNSSGLTGDQFNPSNAEIDTNYQFTYTESGVCGRNIAVNVTIHAPLALTGESIELCINEPSIDLTALLGNDFVAGGTWTDDDSSGGISGDRFDPSIVNLENFQFTYSEPGACGRTIAVGVNVHDDCIAYPCETPDSIEISKVVTANNDGYNDVFEISDLEPCDFTADVQIFNRWGKIVYQSANYQNDWNGYDNGGALTIGSNNKLPTGTYYYVISITGSSYKPITGYIYLGTQ